MKQYISCALCLGLLACASNPNKISEQVNNIGEAGEVKITDLTKTRDMTSGNYLVRFKFNATGDKPQQVYWRCEFMDANGFPVGDPGRFAQETIYPNAPVLESCAFPSATAVDFKINVQNVATNMINYN